MLTRLRNRFPRRRTSRAAILSRLAGLPGGLRQTRRGSFLIMVVGTLALIAVITVVYVAIGRSDRQTSAAAIRVEERKDVPAAMRDYIAGIIADDVFDVVFLGESMANPNNPNNQIPLFRREAWDYPSTAHTIDLPRLLPGGIGVDTTAVTVGRSSNGQDPRVQFNPTGNYTGTDPWLASSEPTLHNFAGNALNNESDPTIYWRERLDWDHISNVAPDGAYVNLFYLRDNFNATPEEMRAELRLNDVSPENTRVVNTDYGTTTERADMDSTIPAEWSNRQNGAAYGMIDPIYYPDEFEHLSYQWADADGDGIADSRWFEMVEDRDPSDDLVIQLLDPDSQYRYFFAVRITDLSGRVNVNTATDSTLAPSEDDPFGFTPAAVDIRRLLTYEDSYADTRNVFPGAGTYGFGPNAHWQQPDYPKPANPDSTQDYAEYDETNAYYVGATGYDSLRAYLDLGVALGPGYQGLIDIDTGTGTSRAFAVADRNTLNPYWASYQKIGGSPFTPSDYYELFAGTGAGGIGNLTGGGVVRSGIFRPFGEESLLDLLAFNTANDDRNISPLEVAIDGRAELDNPVPAYLAERYGPLRSNRSTSLERTRSLFVNLTPTFLDEARAALYTDIRQRLTTESGVRPLQPSPIPSVQSGKRYFADPAEIALDSGDLKTTRDTLFDTASNLFEFYADALAPYAALYSGSDSVWDSDYVYNNAAPNLEYATLFYGYRGPHLAVRTAAHLAVNMRDAYDQGSSSTIRTLVLNNNNAFRGKDLSNTIPRNAYYPWQLLDLDANNTSLAKRLPDLTANPIAGIPDAVNIHGIEAQPFLVEAASFIMYTDTPRNSPDQGDRDWPHDTNGDGLPEPFFPSINGDPTASNPDCLFEVVAFQLHNPFDVSVTIAPGDDTTGTPPGQYYIQYGDKYYKLSDFDRETGVETPGTVITIGPGNSHTFYALSANTSDILGRINNALPGTETIDIVHDWLDTQLGGAGSASRVLAFNPQSGDIEIPSGDFQQLQSGPDSDRQVIRLFRVEKPVEDPNGGFEVLGPSESLSQGNDFNNPTNDTLVDRMRDPSGSVTLDRYLDPSPNSAGEIQNADPGFEPPNVGYSEDNQGLTIVRWGRVSRREDPNAGSGSNPPRGALPAYCLESKAQTDTRIRNITDDEGAPDNNLDISDFQNNNWSEQTLRDALDSQIVTKIVPTISQDPQDKDEGTTENIGTNLDNVAFRDLYPEAHLDNDEFKTAGGVSTMRIADILLPLGIGPHQIPDPAFNLGDQDIEWTTLSEALAFALYYENPNANESVYNSAFVPPTLPNDPSNLLDRGNLQIDAFVPFYDNDINGAYDLTADPDDRRWGLGVPLAATLIDRFTSLDRRFGSLVSPTYGQLNINTVSRETARSIPGLSPNEDLGLNGTSRWWWTEPDFNWQSDIATTLVAYRDRLAMFPRDPNGSAPASLLNFRDWWQPDLTTRAGLPGTGFVPGSTFAERNGDNARQGTTGIRGLRETPGFRSLGEMLLLRDLGYVNNNLSYPAPHDIDRLGFDGDTIDIDGVDSIAYSNSQDQIDDDYDERLALANAALASTNVRSDYFAVWFLMHGYREGDVTNLRDEDPLVPSVARRFLMVIDRSNVIEPGDKPRIVLFKEVPL